MSAWNGKEGVDLEWASALGSLSLAGASSERLGSTQPTLNINASTTSAKPKSVVMVHNLDPRTTQKGLLNMFFPLGAVDAIISNDANGRKKGCVMFNNPDVARSAASKLHDFVPHGQSQPLIVEYTPQPGEQEHTGSASSQPAPARPVPKPVVLEWEKFLHSVDRGETPSAPDILRWCSVSSDAELSAFIVGLVRAVVSPHAQAMKCVVEVMSILTSAPLKVRTQTHLSRNILQALLDARATKGNRIKYGIIAGYLFDGGVISGTPFGMAVKLMQNRDQKDLDIVDALVSMTQTWSLRNSGARFDPAELEFNRSVAEFNSVPRTPPDTPAKDSVMSTPDRTPGYTGNEAEALRCTVFVSKLPPCILEADLRALLVTFGELNKVRLYESKGAKGTYAFVEFSHPHEAHALVGKSGTVGFGDVAIRCLPARSPIHDTDPRDALLGGDGVRVRGCLFGLTPKPRKHSTQNRSHLGDDLGDEFQFSTAPLNF